MALDRERQSRTVDALANSPLDAIVCAGPTEVLLLTGYWPVMSASIAVIHSTGELILVVPEDEVELAEATSSAQVIPYSPAGLHSLDEPLHLLKQPLRAATKGLASATVGVQRAQGVQPCTYAVMNRYRNSLIESLNDLLPHATLAGCDSLLDDMKPVKTSIELKMMQLGSRIAEAGFAVASAAIHPGLRETEVAAAFQSAFERAPEAQSLQRSYGSFFCMSGPNSARAAAAYARTRQRTIKSGDLVMIHANTCADGYWTDLTRTYTAGKPSHRHIEIRGAIDEAREAGLRSIRPGATGKEVDHAVRSVMESHRLGDAFKHASGHGVGFAAANPNARPRIHPLSSDVLQRGMTFNIEPAAYIDGYGGMRHCDLVAVTHSGAEVISNFEVPC